MARTPVLIYAIFFFLGASCSNGPQPDHEINPKQPVEISSDLIRTLTDTVFLVNGRAVTIDYPNEQIRGAILCLPGWNFSRTDVCEKSTFCDEAKKAGYVLLLPEMGKSIYASAVFPETRSDWKGFPQLSFIVDTLIPTLQNQFNLMQYGQDNFMYGISTGARGVAMIALHTDSLFKAGAALSGDYEQTRMPEDNLMKGYYGGLDKFKDRWMKDNPYMHAEQIIIPLYLAHGEKDNIVPVEQTRIFYEKLNGRRNYPKVLLHTSTDAAHDYTFWGGETNRILDFFRKFSSN